MTNFILSRIHIKIKLSHTYKKYMQYLFYLLLFVVVNIMLFFP